MATPPPPVLWPGTRVVILRHPQLHPESLWGYEGTVQTVLQDAYLVAIKGIARPLTCRLDIICPVYNDCEVCGYAAYRNENWGSDLEPEFHHFCAWCRAIQ